MEAESPGCHAMQTCLNAELELEERDELAIMFAAFSFALINVLLIFHNT